METQPLARPARNITLLARIDGAIDRRPNTAMAIFAVVAGGSSGFVSAVAAGDMALGGHTWFDAQTTSHWAFAAGIAGICVAPLVSGFFARTWFWLLMTGAVAFAAIFTGAAIGLTAARLAFPREWAIQQRQPDDFLPTSPGGILIFWGLMFGFLIAAASAYHAAIGTALGKSRNGGAAPKPRRDWSQLIFAAMLILIEWFVVGRHL